MTINRIKVFNKLISELDGYGALLRIEGASLPESLKILY